MKNQSGATLVIVLVMLLLVTLLGGMAVRSGILDLRISTNSQVNALLLENNNSAFFNIEDPNNLLRQLAADGIFAHFNAAGNINDELVFCYRAASVNSFYLMSNRSIIKEDGATSGSEGFCKDGEFSSGRSAIQSQIHLRKVLESSAPFLTVPTGTSLGQSNVPTMIHSVSFTVISILPNFANATKNQIETCFKKTAYKKPTTGDTVGECFAKLGIPYNLQRGDYTVGGSPKLIS